MKKGMKLLYPATRWEDALPCGNGTTGAMVYGHIRDEIILINREELYYRDKPKPAFNEISSCLPQAREKLLSGKYREGEDFFMDKLKENFIDTGGSSPFQPFCDLLVTQHNKSAFTDYKRTLDFETGEAVVSWIDGSEYFTRKLFVSLDHDLIVLSLEGTGLINARFQLCVHNSQGADGMGSGNDEAPEMPPYRHESVLEEEENQMRFTAFFPNEEGVEIPFQTQAKILPAGGQLIKQEKEIEIKNAESILVLIKTRKESPWPKDSTYKALFTPHKENFSSLFNRTSINLNTQKNEYFLSNEELLLGSSGGNVSETLIQKLHDYGRYLLISSSIQGQYPANLQGIWNGDFKPAWASDFHNDENIQMNYWAAPMGNLPQTMVPLFNFYDSFKDDYRENAAKLYGCRGFLLPICHTTNGMIYKPTIWDCWTGAGGWIAQHYFDYWLYTGDRDFLKYRAIPFMREVCLFYLDFLYEDESGRLISAPSLSPENKAQGQDTMICVNSTMDFAIAKEVLTNLLSSYSLLVIDDPESENFHRLLKKIPPYEINKDGALKEWMYPGLEDNYHQRHQSHLYPIFPGHEITADSDKSLFEACRKAVEKRLVVGLTSQTGWSLVHMANIYARLGEGNRALECLELLCRSTVGSNLFTYHNDWRSQGITMYWGPGSKPPFQIDANFGFTAAVLEMLVFSDEKSIRLLPGLPDKWLSGKATGILCRGGYEIDVEWKNGLLERVRIRGGWRRGTLTVTYQMDSLIIHPEGDRPIELGVKDFIKVEENEK